MKVFVCGLAALAACGMLLLGLTTLAFAQDWEIQNPQPPTARMIAVDFRSATVGWALSDDGMVLATTDGGTTWSSRWLPEQRGWSAFDFLDAEHGWALSGRYSTSDTCVVARTVDGGQTWNVVARTDSLSGPARIHFVDTQSGWIISRLNRTLLRTTDGGLNWHVQRCVEHQELMDIAMQSATTGWVVGVDYSTHEGLALHTTDGGQSWQEQIFAAPSANSRVCFVDADHGWIISGTNPFQCRTILRTTNGGATWSSWTATDIHTFTALAFTNALNGWALGWNGTSNPSVILHTTDGGASWTPAFTTADTALNALAAFGNQHVWAVGEESVMVRSGDGGATWPSQQRGYREDLCSVAFTDNHTGWAAGNWNSWGSDAYSALLHTTDGGLNWTRQLIDTSAHVWPRHLTFSSPSCGWLVGSGGILHTADSGASW